MSVLPAAAQATCGGPLTELTAEQRTTAANVERSSGAAFSTFTCQNVAGVSRSDRGQRCVTNLCGDRADVVCCAPGTGGREGSTGGATSTGGTTDTGGFFRLRLPACVESGNCTLDDIVTTGVNFANFLFGISGAILLATFVYAGVLYLTAGSSGNVGKAKDMLKNALIGMVLVFGAGLLVTTVYDTFRSDTRGGEDACRTSARPNFSCQYLDASLSDAAGMQAEMDRRGCIPNLCAGDETRRCCPDPGSVR